MQPSVLITGASSGIGAAAAGYLAARGFTVFGTSRRPAEAAARAPQVRWIEMDVCDDGSVAKALEAVRAATPQLDALVANAGFGIFGSVEEVSLESARAQLETNFFGVLRLLRAVLPEMRERRSGRIAVVGSLAGRAPIPFQAHYSASKAALDALVLALRNELHGSGVEVSLIEPGDIDTGFNAVMEWGDPARSAYGERIRNTERVIRESLPKAPKPDVVARAIHHALTARRPRVRYAVGREALPVSIGRRLLPDRWVLKFIRDHFGI